MRYDGLVVLFGVFLHATGCDATDVGMEAGFRKSEPAPMPQQVCHPLHDDCSPGNVCIPSPSGSPPFTCALDASPPPEFPTNFPVCLFANACLPNYFCDGGLCYRFCNVDDDEGVCAPESCEQYFRPGPPPAGYEEVGACGPRPDAE